MARAGKTLLALSVRQPWAGLLVAGIKTIEVRRWSVRYRGSLLIHAARHIDEEVRSWQVVAAAAVRCPWLWEWCTLRGGIIGRVELAGCRRYTTPMDFAAD